MIYPNGITFMPGMYVHDTWVEKVCESAVS